jgi:hypothetical protein
MDRFMQEAAVNYAKGGLALAGKIRLVRFCLYLLPLLFPLGGCNQATWQQMGREILGNHEALSVWEIDAGLKEALRVGSERVTDQLGKADGFNADRVIRIPLPEQLAATHATLERMGMGAVGRDLEVRLNRAAEAAAPKAKGLFWQAIRDLSMQDARAIFRGPEDAATRYFQGRMGQELAVAMRPLVEESLNQVGAIRVYSQALQQVRAMPYAPEIKTDLTAYVVERGMAGIFHYLAREEAAIRNDPARRTTELLQRVFGSRH